MPRTAQTEVDPVETIEPALSRRVLVIIAKDNLTKTPRVVWQHEIPILEEVFGEGNCEPGNVAAMNEGFNPRASSELKPFNKSQENFLPPSETASIGYVFIGDASAEFARLIAVYGRHPDENVSFAERVYGRFNDGKFKRLLGKPRLEDLGESQLRAMIREYGYLPNVAFDAEQAEKNAVAAKVTDLNRAKQGDLIKLAREVGVEMA